MKLNRISGWVLLFLMLMFIFSGYELFGPVFSRYLHEKLLVIPFFVFFLVHLGINLKYAFKRWKIFKADPYILIFCLILFILFLYLFFK